MHIQHLSSTTLSLLNNFIDTCVLIKLLIVEKVV